MPHYMQGPGKPQWFKWHFSKDQKRAEGQLRLRLSYHQLHCSNISHSCCSHCCHTVRPPWRGVMSTHSRTPEPSPGREGTLCSALICGLHHSPVNHTVSPARARPCSTLEYFHFLGVATSSCSCLFYTWVWISNPWVPPTLPRSGIWVGSARLLTYNGVQKHY